MTPFELTSGRIPVIIHVPHSSTVFPKRLLEDSAVLNPEIDLRGSCETIADLHADKIADLFVKRTGLRPYVFKSTMSRMFFDPERFNSEEEEMNDVGMGVIYTKNHKGENIYSAEPSAEDRAERIRKYYDQYSQSFTETVNHVLNRYNEGLILDLHSYSSQPLFYELHGDEERSPLVIGYDSYHTQNICDPLSTVSSKAYVSTNTVFKGSYVPLKHYRSDSRVSSVMFEIRKDTYMDESCGNFKPTAYLDAIFDDMETLVAPFASSYDRSGQLTKTA